jgi:hypothetical protein
MLARLERVATGVTFWCLAGIFENQHCAPWKGGLPARRPVKPMRSKSTEMAGATAQAEEILAASFQMKNTREKYACELANRSTLADSLGYDPPL